MGGSAMHIQFAELPVFDQERAKRFYVGHFDCRVVAD
jgi:predicted enzyme related to lactoylglutathione lyase